MATPNQYDLARQRAAGQAESQRVQGQDAIQRRAAKLGNLNAGVVAKQSQLNEQAVAQNLSSANEGINAQQQAEAERLAEAERGRTFQAGESALSRRHATTEREGSQSWQTGERQGSQTFATGEREGAQTFTAGQNAAAIQAEKENLTAQLASQEGIAKGQLDLQTWSAKQNVSLEKDKLAFDKMQAGIENDEAKKNNEITALMNMADQPGANAAMLAAFAQAMGFQYVTADEVVDIYQAKHGPSAAPAPAPAVPVSAVPQRGTPNTSLGRRA